MFVFGAWDTCGISAYIASLRDRVVTSCSYVWVTISPGYNRVELCCVLVWDVAYV